MSIIFTEPAQFLPIMA